MTISVETFVCSVRGHVTPAATVAVLVPEEHGFGIDVHPTWRICRCLRCDVWVGVPPPDPAELDRLPPFEALDLPRRGKALRQAVILRLIAIERAIHAVIFAAIVGLGLLLRSHLAGAQSSVRDYLETLARNEAQTGRANNHSIVAQEGTKFLHLRSSTLEVLVITAAVYAIIEGTEAVGLWYEKRWAEYLTAVATAGFIPFEVRELIKKVTVVRVGALVVNLAIMGYLVYAKHLFGVGRKRAEARLAESAADRSVFSPPF
ncbi:MAG: hypothetical protein QOF30_1853 [Acidimicrobiaceae bacterium]|nr:hypothetical protein [Acidimicrobiaceae bacterium]